MSRRLLALLTAAVAVLFLVSAAGADNQTTFTDPVGDAGSSLDITELEVSDYEGYLSFWVTFARQFPLPGRGRRRGRRRRNRHRPEPRHRKRLLRNRGRARLRDEQFREVRRRAI